MSSDIIINRRIVREASLKFLSSIESLKHDSELLEATADDLTSIMIRALLESLASDEVEESQEKTQKEEEVRDVLTDLPEDVVRQESEQLRASFLAKLQQRMKPTTGSR
jgi:hypothetical protein